MAVWDPKEAEEVIRKLLSLVNDMAEGIVAEIIDAMNVAASSQGKNFGPTALDEWVPKLKAAVKSKLMQGGNWTQDRTNVLKVASDMALIAAILVGPQPNINKAQAHAAFRACKHHQTCPGNLGSGAWCDFDV